MGTTMDGVEVAEKHDLSMERVLETTVVEVIKRSTAKKDL